MSTQANRGDNNGLALAFCTYLICGLMPLYLRLVHQVPPFEFVGWRIIFTLPLCLVLVLVLRQGAALRAALAWPVLRLLLLSSVLIGINWLVYIAAVQSGHVLATSIGYYINPLANVLAGTLLLGERLSQRQWLAVGLAATGVSLLAWDARDTLWISLTLAASFCAYGVVRKLAPVESLAGLTVETMALLLPALAIVGWYAQGPGGSALGVDLSSSLLIAASGLITAVPLLMFAMAARRMDYSALGMVQFFSPTIVFFLGLFVFHEPLNPGQLACFVLIWAAIAVFMWDLWVQRRLGLVEQAPA
ncbi:MAG: EamA family transporter RarD [Novosphingobium sp.]